MVAARCVPFGIGNDIAGSLRFPSVFCGIYGFKPTQDRLSKRGMTPCLRKRIVMKTPLKGTNGPMGASVSDLITGLKIELDEEIYKFDPNCAPSPWRDEMFQ